MFTPGRHTPNGPFEARFSRAFESRLDWNNQLGHSPRCSPPLDDDQDFLQEEAQREHYEVREQKDRESGNPLSHSTSLIEVIHDDEDHIDVEEEEAAYRAFDLDESDNSALGLSSRDSRPKLSTTGPRPRPPSSILSHDIWVGENDDAERDSSFARGVRIVGWTSVGDQRGGAYIVYDCAILTRAQTTIHIHKRFSAFLNLYSTLLLPSSSLSKSARKHVSPLPARTPLAKFRPAFLESRRKSLQAWLSSILLHPEIGGCSAVREWVMAG